MNPATIAAVLAALAALAAYLKRRWSR